MAHPGKFISSRTKPLTRLLLRVSNPVFFSDEDRRLYEACRDLDRPSWASFEDLLQGRVGAATDDYTNEEGVLRDTARREIWKLHMRLGAIEVLALGTLFVLEGEEATGSYYFRKPCALKRRRAGFTIEHAQFYCEKTPSADMTLEQYLMANWYPPQHGTSPAGVPWEITTILDRDARAAALRGYWAA